MDPYARREGNCERELMEAVIETTYRRLIRQRGIGISLGDLHNMVAHTQTLVNFVMSRSMSLK
jgi:hypothetical protein